MSDLLHVSQISVLSEEDRRTLHEARRWVRFIVLQAVSSKLPTMEDKEEQFAFRFDGMERQGLSDLLERLDDMAARTSGEPQFSEVRR